MAKNIVLLSDGTGNSAAKLFKTNVWRLYQALDLSPASDQVAFYDDGVGTSTFRPLALLGGALGFGLKRNVKQLYTFLCQNYVPDDRIYAFGFSRGAFTIRVLAGMIATQGIIPGKTIQPEELRRAVDAAWKADRKDYRTHWRWWRHRETATEVEPTIPPDRDKADIEFVGVWDTVDAYGMPVDELKRGLDYWLLGLSFPDQDLSPIVKRACHALALDDERRTFHPVLWNERFEKELIARGKAEPDRLRQIWFMGMHSNVGGGYARDELSYVSLNWMAAEAAAVKLKFHKADLDEFERRANPHGDMGNSRAGTAAYYRYDPRRVKELCNDSYNKVWIDRPKIHHSVLDRIKLQHALYVPHVIPAEYDVVGPNGKVIENTYETPDHAMAREEHLKRSWDLVWWRRIAYFVTLGFTVLLLVFPWMGRVQGASGCTGPWCFAEPVLVGTGYLLPDLAHTWIDAYRLNMGMFILLAAGLVLAMAWGILLERRIRGFAGEAWSALNGRAVTEPLKPGVSSQIARQLWTSRPLVAAYRWFARHALPFLFFIATVLALLISANRLLFDFAEALGLTCDGTAIGERNVPGKEPVVISAIFETSNPCFSTGVSLEQSAAYTISFKILQPWQDGTKIVTNPGGFTTAKAAREAGWRFRLAAPLRRSWRSNWFSPVARVGHLGFDEYHLDISQPADQSTVYVSKPFIARTEGEVFLFVNDAVLALPGIWSYFYNGTLDGQINNKGSAEVTITRVSPAPQP
jgi:uncharacterized protein (DUF2235 family)